jgi:hypothetical protein
MKGCHRCATAAISDLRALCQLRVLASRGCFRSRHRTAALWRFGAVFTALLTLAVPATGFCATAPEAPAQQPTPTTRRMRSSNI